MHHHARHHCRLSKYANYSVIFGSVLHICNLCALYFSGHMNMITLGILVSIAETAILMFRVVVILRHRDLLVTPPDTEEET